MKSNIKGFVPVIAVIIAVVILISAVGGFLFLRSRQPAVPALEKQNSAAAQPGEVTAKDVAALAAPGVTLDFNVSPIKDIGLTGLDLGPSFSGNALTDLSLDTRVGFSGSTGVSVPAVNIEAPKVSVTSGTPPAAQPPASQPPAQSQVNAANCAQFSSIPGAQYCSYVTDPNGRTLCEQCKAAGL